jgi:hypothetical protein
MLAPQTPCFTPVRRAALRARLLPCTSDVSSRGPCTRRPSSCSCTGEWLCVFCVGASPFSCLRRGGQLAPSVSPLALPIFILSRVPVILCQRPVLPIFALLQRAHTSACAAGRREGKGRQQQYSQLEGWWSGAWAASGAAVDGRRRGEIATARGQGQHRRSRARAGAAGKRNRMGARDALSLRRRSPSCKSRGSGAVRVPRSLSLLSAPPRPIMHTPRLHGAGAQTRRRRHQLGQAIQKPRSAAPHDRSDKL